MKKILTLVLLIFSVQLLLYFWGKLDESNKEETVTISSDGNTELIDLEDYLVGVVACEMPVLYGSEALKAQAIASRTYALYKSSLNKVLSTSVDDQCYITDEEMKKKWGNSYTEYKNLVSNSIKETEGIIIKKNNQLFKTFYFSTSNGFTEDSYQVFGEGEISSVESSFDKESNNYKKEVNFKKEDLEKILGKFSKLIILERSNTHHVTKVSVDNNIYTGIEFRNKLKLRSTDFDFEEKDNNYIFTTYGYGHGVGMSQFGASYLGKQGYDYKYILKYYYGDITFEKI